MVARRLGVWGRQTLLGTILVALGLSLGGCAGYRLGAPAAPFSTVEIAAVRSEAMVLGAGPIVHQQLTEAFLQDGTVQPVPTGGEAQLSVVVVGYDRESALAQAGDTGRPAGVRITLRVVATLTQAGQPLFADRPFSVSELVLADDAQGSFALGESQTLPILARRLAQQVRDAVAQSWAM